MVWCTQKLFFVGPDLSTCSEDASSALVQPYGHRYTGLASSSAEKVWRRR